MSDPEKPFDIVDAAGNHVERYLDTQFGLSYHRTEKERQGDGCGCPQCARLTVEDTNRYVFLITHDNGEGMYYTTAMVNGVLKIISPDEKCDEDDTFYDFESRL